MQPNAMPAERRAMHDAFHRAREAFLNSQEALQRAKEARDRGRDDGPRRAEYQAWVRSFHELNRAAHELAVEVEPSCRATTTDQPARAFQLATDRESLDASSR
jgi:hypothetical protein